MMLSRAPSTFALVIAAGVVLASAASVAQNTAAPGQREPGPTATAAAIPTGRTGRGGYPMPGLPAVFETLQHKVRVWVVAHGLDRPWSLLILPDGDMLVSMRYSNEIRAIRKGVFDPKPLGGLPEMRRMLDIVMHPNFAENKWIYFDYAKPLNERQTAMVLARGRYDGNSLTNVQELYVSDPTPAGGSRLAFAPDGRIYMTPSGAVARRAANDPGDLATAPG